MSNPDDYLDQRDVELAALAEENRRLREALEFIRDNTDETLSNNVAFKALEGTGK